MINNEKWLRENECSEIHIAVAALLGKRDVLEACAANVHILPDAEIEIAARVSILRELGLTLQTVTVGGNALIPMRWGNFDYGTEGYENSKRYPGVVDARQEKVLTAKKVGDTYIVESWYDCMFVITEAGVDLGGGLGCSRHTDFGTGPAWSQRFFFGERLTSDTDDRLEGITFRWYE